MNESDALLLDTKALQELYKVETISTLGKMCIEDVDREAKLENGKYVFYLSFDLRGTYVDTCLWDYGAILIIQDKEIIGTRISFILATL